MMWRGGKPPSQACCSAQLAEAGQQMMCCSGACSCWAVAQMAQQRPQPQCCCDMTAHALHCQTAHWLPQPAGLCSQPPPEVRCLTRHFPLSLTGWCSGVAACHLSQQPEDWPPRARRQPRSHSDHAPGGRAACCCCCDLPWRPAAMPAGLAAGPPAAAACPPQPGLQTDARQTSSLPALPPSHGGVLLVMVNLSCSSPLIVTNTPSTRAGATTRLAGHAAHLHCHAGQWRRLPHPLPAP